MAVLTGVRLPSLAPVKARLLDRLQTDLQDALDAALDQAPDPLLDFGSAPMLAPDPRNFGQAVITSYDQVQAWPSVMVTGWGLALRETGEQLLTGRWEGSIELAAFLRDGNPDRLAAALDRWGAALYAVALSADADLDLAGASLTPAIAIEPREPGGRTATDRVVLVTLGVAVWP